MADRRTSSCHQVLLSLGSNIEPEKNLPAAVRGLERYGRVLRVSGVWQSPPLGNPAQPDYLNAALWLETGLSAEELKEEAIAVVETALGRLRSGLFAVRITKITRVWVKSDSMNQPVWKRASEAWKIRMST